VGITRDIRDRLIAVETLMSFEGSAVNAAAYVPEDIGDFQVPIFINHAPSGARRIQFADTYYKITRTWTLSLWGQKVGDALLSYNEDRMMDLIDLTYALFLPRPRLEVSGQGMSFVEQALLTGDRDIEIRPYPTGADDSAAFYVVDFSMEITYQVVCYD